MAGCGKQDVDLKLKHQAKKKGINTLDAGGTGGGGEADQVGTDTEGGATTDALGHGG